jgi:hypothetical protein
MALATEVNIHRGMSGDAPVPVAVAVHHSQKDDASEVFEARERIGIGAGLARTHAGIPGLEQALRERRARADEEDGGAPAMVEPFWIAIDADGVVRSAAMRGGWWNEQSLFRSLAGR